MADEVEKCPLCGGNATVRGLDMGRDGKDVTCVVCGQFEITRNAIIGLKSKAGDTELLPYLICHTRSANERGEVFNVASHNWREFAQAHKNTPLSRRIEKLLQLLVSRSQFEPGRRVRLNERTDWPLVDVDSEKQFGYLLGYLTKEDYVTTDAMHYVLEPKAWEKFERAGTRQGIPGKCFVAMSFHESLKEAYDSGIFLAVKTDCNMDPVRIDRVHHNEKICDKLIAEIRTSQFLVANVTLQRPGVYFEAGFAMGLGRPVIWTCRDDDLPNVHFDTRQYSHVVWTDPQDLRTKLADRIKATIPGAV